LFVSGSDSYIGSTNDLYRRCFIQHKNNAYAKTKKHKLFYNKVVKKGWDLFTLNILYLIPKHLHIFTEKYLDYILTNEDIQILRDLTNYELTIAEQLQLDFYKPNLNISLLANYSSYNIGSLGYVRTEEMNSRLSLSYLNRSYSPMTKLMHRKNNLGKKLSDLTKDKISKSSGGIPIKLININSNNSTIIFKNKTLLAKELNISLRTVNRWLDDGKIHLTKSLKYPKVKIVL
jgi:group I intron endonuclease